MILNFLFISSGHQQRIHPLGKHLHVQCWRSKGHVWYVRVSHEQCSKSLLDSTLLVGNRHLDICIYIYTYIIACDNCLHQLGRMWILITAPNEMRRTSKCFKFSPCWMHSIILRNPKLQQLEDLKWKPQYAAICFNQEAVISSFDSTKLLACIFLHQLSRMMIPKNQPIVTNLTKTWRPAYPCKHCRRGSSAGSALPGRAYHIHHKKARRMHWEISNTEL